MSSSSGLAVSEWAFWSKSWSFGSKPWLSPLKASSLRREELGVATAEGTKVGVGLRPVLKVEWRWALRTLLKWDLESKHWNLTEGAVGLWYSSRVGVW